MTDTAAKTLTPVDLTESNITETSTQETPKNPNFVVRGLRWIRDRLGFRKTYNTTLWIIFGGALAGFCLSRFMLMDIHGVYKDNAGLGEYYMAKTKKIFRICLILHLAFVLPGGLLSVFQFIPRIRYVNILIHRINGYIILLLLTLGTIPGFILLPHSFGGHLSSSSAGVVLGAATLIALYMAYYNIKVLQIDQHRKWMLRAMFYMSTIITTRLVQAILMGAMVTKGNDMREVWECGQLGDVIDGGEAEVLKRFSTCRESGYAMVRVGDGHKEGFASALRIGFGPALWIAFVLHAVGVEIYIRLTAGETERLRMVSWERQMERGMKNPGSVGSTADHWGDATWKPEVKEEVRSS